MQLAVLESWRIDFRLLLILIAALWIYIRGWRHLGYSLSRLVAFITGIAAVYIALASPLDAFGNLLLQVHMIQHLLLIMIAPPLIWYGQPVLAFLRGLPRSFVRNGLSPFLTWPALNRIGRAITHPVVCWFAFAFVILF